MLTQYGRKFHFPIILIYLNEVEFSFKTLCNSAKITLITNNNNLAAKTANVNFSGLILLGHQLNIKW